MPPLCASGPVREVGTFREWRGPSRAEAVGTLLPGAACQNAAMNVAIVATVVLGLAVDRHWMQYGQAAASAAAWLVCVALFARSTRTTRVSLAACLAIATAGEVVLSLAWGLYRYRLGNIPLFVPPGHVLLFFLGTQIARRMPERGAWLVALLALPLVALTAWSGRDTLGPLLYALFLACLWLAPSRRLYATMFVLSLAMELYGTWMGNWVWSARVPGLGLSAANPPLAAGAFYSVLDLLVVAAGSALERTSSRRSTRAGRISAAGEARIEPERGLAPCGDAQRVLVLAIAPDHLEAERQPAQAAARGDRDGGHRGLRP